MNTLNTIIGKLSLPIALVAFVYSVASLLETDVNWYKAGFYFVVMTTNMGTYLDYRSTK